MATLWAKLRRREPEAVRYTVDDYVRWLMTNQYGLFPTSYSGRHQKEEQPEVSFEAYVYQAYKANGVVFACMVTRQLVFSEARFQFRQLRDGRPGDLFGTPELSLLERPWPNGTTGQLLTRMIQDVDLAGNFYAVNEGDRVRRLRPDWVTIVLSSPPEEAVEVDVIGYQYWPGGIGNGPAETYTVDEVCHWAPIPDPVAQYRGMSWLTPVMREIQGDQAATEHKLAFFRNGATLGPIFRVPAEITPAQFKEFVKASDEAHAGAENAYKPVYVGGGADVTLGSANMQQMDFKVVQGAGETRIAAAARVHPVLVGLSEGMQGSSLNAGNYSAAKRSFADGTMRPLWRDACGALATIMTVPAGAELWYDDRDIAYLREDAKDIAEIQSLQAAAIRQLGDAGYKPDEVIDAIDANDLSRLKGQHSGLFSVQLQPPGAGQDNNAATPASGGPQKPSGQASRSADDEWDTDPIGDLDEDTELLLEVLDEVAPSATRALSGAAFNAKHKRGPNGRFITMLDRIKEALDDWKKNGANVKADPFKDFSREQLRKVAKSRGVQLKRGEDRDSIAAKIIADLRQASTPSAAPVTTTAKKAAPKPGSATAQRAGLNTKAIAAAKAVADGSDPKAHVMGHQLAVYGTLTKADFDSLDTQSRAFIMSDLGTINLVGSQTQSAKAWALVSRFNNPGTAPGVIPKPPAMAPAGAATKKVAAATVTGTPGLLKKAKDPGLSGDGWFHPPGGGKAVWGKYGAAGLLLRHRGDDGVDRFLMVQRGPAISDPGKWQFPGGAIDSKESPYEGATREVLEELGFKDADLVPGLVHGTHEASVAGGAWKYTSIAATVPTQIKPDLSTHHARAETSDAKWMTADEIRKLDTAGKLLAPLAGGKLEQNVLSLFPKTPGKTPAKPKTPPLPKHKPSKGRDLVSDKASIDKLRQDVKRARKAYAGKVADDRLAAIGAMQGYDDTPTVATKAEVDKLLATGDYVEVWRGVHGQGYSGKTAAQIHEEMRSGPAWYGKGVFGNGYYLATDKRVAEQYSDGTKGSVARILIPKSAVMADHGDMVKQARAHASARSKAKGSREDGTLWDEGRWAAAKGVDGIVIQHTSGRAQGLSAGHVARPGAPAYNWLNRSVLVIQEG